MRSSLLARHVFVIAGNITSLRKRAELVNPENERKISKFTTINNALHRQKLGATNQVLLLLVNAPSRFFPWLLL